jgi:hypothetical protein
MRQTDMCNNSYYHTASIAAYGHSFIEQAMRIVGRTDNDETLIKLIIPILAFSTWSDVLHPDEQTNPGNNSH